MPLVVQPESKVWQYADISINYGKKRFYEIGHRYQFHKLFGIIYAPSGAT
jgi:hypothetical protein